MGEPSGVGDDVGVALSPPPLSLPITASSSPLALQRSRRMVPAGVALQAWGKS